jgi:hypothetical protein
MLTYTTYQSMNASVVHADASCPSFSRRRKHHHATHVPHTVAARLSCMDRLDGLSRSRNKTLAQLDVMPMSVAVFGKACHERCPDSFVVHALYSAHGSMAYMAAHSLSFACLALVQCTSTAVMSSHAWHHDVGCLMCMADCSPSGMSAVHALERIDMDLANSCN